MTITTASRMKRHSRVVLRRSWAACMVVEGSGSLALRLAGRTPRR